MEIYLDVVWALNFLLDFMLLLLTKGLARVPTKNVRIFFGAFVAASIVPISFYFPDSFFTTVAGKILFSLIIILSAFGFITIYRYFQLLFIFYFTTFAIGGGLIGLHFLFSHPISLSNNGIVTVNSGYGDPISWLFVIIGFPIVWIFTKRRMDKHGIDKIRYNNLYKVSIQIKDQSFSTIGYIDSGNHLTDPITKKPVIICDESFLKQWFTDGDWKKLKDSYEQLDMEELPKEWENLIQIVPYQGVEGSSSFLYTIRPEKLTVQYNNQQLVTSKVLVGIQFGNLVRDQSYHCLLQPQIIQLARVHSA